MPELRKDRLSFLEAIGQSVANVSPTLTPAIAVAVVVATAGTASWLVYVLATIALVSGACVAATQSIAALSAAASLRAIAWLSWWYRSAK